ncbi:MAG: noncanonical pyrimidine nucleotidase, YjjG family [Bacteroidia bacterium]|nr:noncanonical pyrimidine nucleotidase, YjjG family [Bacteroidia bacterium]
MNTPGPFRHIFFDLDHTLWDFEANSAATLEDLFKRYRRHIGTETDFDAFYFHYSHVNKNLWALYREDKISQSFLRSRRFPEAFEKMGFTAQPWMDEFGDAYIKECPTQGRLMDQAIPVLDRLKEKYSLHIITNGFDETQGTKLRSSGLEPYFQHVITSQMAAAKKPNPVIFEFALQLAGARREESAFVGDDYEADVIGGLEFGIFTVFFNPDGKTNPLKSPEVRNLIDLERYF